MSTRISEPPKGSLFSFKQYGCKCMVEKHYEDDGSESYWLQIISDKNSEIELYHDFKRGLNRSDADAGKFRDIIHELPQSHDLKLLMKKFSENNVFEPKVTPKSDVKHNEEDYALEMKRFFETFGFLFPINDKAVLVSVKEIGAFLDRAYVVSQLISELNNNSPVFEYNYNKIFDYVFILAFSDDRIVHDCRHGYNVIYTIPKHPLVKRLRSMPEKTNESYTRSFMQYKNLFEHYAELKKAFHDYDEIIKIQEKDFRQNYNLKYYVEHFEDGEREYNEALKQFEQSTINNAVCYIVNDSFLDKYYGKIFPLEEKNDEMIEHFVRESVFCTELLKAHTAKMDQENRQEKLFLDFLIHFMEEVVDIVDVSVDKFYPLIIMEKVDLMFNVAFTAQFKKVLLEIARITLKNEMNEILKTVVPRFNTDDISPSWYVPDLFTAIYYSLFLNSSNEKIEKTCANPTCYRTFSVEILDKKHLYCSPSCSDCIRQRRYKASKATSNTAATS